MSGCRRWNTPWLWLLLVALATGCGGRQDARIQLDTRPLEEHRALEIIQETLGERQFLAQKDVDIELGNKVRFSCDLRAQNEQIAIEFLTGQDRLEIGQLPPPAPGSRLHVLAATTVPKQAGQSPERVYVFLIDERKFVYQYNPTSELRADVTYLEVDSRLRRDLADFLSWYETTKK
jgi:hypothetical protein